MNLCLVEDDTALLNNLRLLLDGEPDIAVTGCFTEAEAARDQ